MCALIVNRQNQALKAKLEATADALNSSEKSLIKNLEHSAKRENENGSAAAFLAYLLENENTDPNLRDSLASISKFRVNCKIETFPDMPEIRLFVFSELIQDEINELKVTRVVRQAKSTCILTGIDDFDIVDFLDQRGLGGVSYMYSNPWLLGWTQDDGTSIEYQITQNGFIKKQ